VTRTIRRCAWAIGALFVFSSCSFFSPQPPLPRRAAIESTGSEEKFATLVQDEDIIYFPSESVALHSRSEAAWKLLDALRRQARSFAFGGDTIEAENDHRVFLAEIEKAGGVILPVRPPAQIRLDQLSRDFEPPPGNFERFAHGFWSRDLPEVKVRVAYEAALLAEQFAALKIVEHFQEHRDGKILVFLRREHLGHDYGVPYFVAQKTKARQLILNPQRHSDSGAGLLARQ
jgi:hypothetical protein